MGDTARCPVIGVGMQRAFGVTGEFCHAMTWFTAHGRFF
jgi:hypothetical protein